MVVSAATGAVGSALRHWPGARVAAWWALPVAQTNAATPPKNWVLMPA